MSFAARAGLALGSGARARLPVQSRLGTNLALLGAEANYAIVSNVAGGHRTFESHT